MYGRAVVALGARLVLARPLSHTRPNRWCWWWIVSLDDLAEGLILERSPKGKRATVSAAAI
jgi:hypothetical protein